MIKIDKLTKIYKTKHKNTCRALDEVSITLPEKGLIFILGKSGSGKSTLLNLIGGLDSFDEGDIVSFGNSLKSFREKDYEAYRSDFVSFIFQDYHLIDELTVLENITLFNSDSIDRQLLDATLATVGMSEYVDRFPTELSGGQKQRVAIARGIMKNPKVILCDEPTGNLDRKTSGQILELLKKLSEEKLVVIVSHNLSEAETFADRIIELADGRIVEDRSKDEKYADNFEIRDGKAQLPYHSRLTDEQLARLNSAIKEGEAKEIELNGSGFMSTEIEYRENKRELTLRKLGKENLMRLFKKFFLSKYRAAISTVLISVMMFGVFSVIQSFLNFDASTALKESLDTENPTVAVEREYTSFPYNIYDDLSVYSGGKTYYMYSQTIWTNNIRGSSWDTVSRMSDAQNLDELYARENYGLLLCDDEYLLDLYGKNGEIPLAAGSLDEARKTGILITDYFADSIIYHEINNKGWKNTTYESLIGVFVPCSVNKSGRIAGIIDTDYEEKYKSIFDAYKELKDSNKEITYEMIEDMIHEDPLYIVFSDDIISNLAVGYSLNPNYIDDFSLDEMSIVRCNGLYFAANGKEETSSVARNLSTLNHKLITRELSDNEIGIPYSLYNLLFGTDYGDEDVNKLDHVEKKTVTVRRYADDDRKGEVLYEMELEVVFVTSNLFIASEKVMYEIKRLDWQPSRVYFKGDADLDGLSSFLQENEYKFIARRQRNVQRISELTNTFRDLFVLLEVTIVAMIAIYLIYFGIRSIKQNSYQIGVIKALGGRTRDVSVIFVLKTFIIGVVIAALSLFAASGFISLADRVLIASIEEVIGMRLDGFSIIKVVPKFLIIDAALIIAVSFISALLPTLLLKKIKPVDIIKAKE